MKELKGKIYAAFAKNAKSMESLRKNTVKYVPGVLKIAKAVILSPEDYEKLAEDISPEYQFLKDNHEFMEAVPGEKFHALLVMTETGPEGILLAQGPDGLYVGRSRNTKALVLLGIPTERIELEEAETYQEHAAFRYQPCHVEDINGKNPMGTVSEGQMGFQVEQIVILSDEQYGQFKENGLQESQVFLFMNTDKMWFDPDKLCWHCLLVKGESSRDGILVDAEGYAHARYAAFVPDCDRLRFRNVPVWCEYPVHASKRQKSKGRDEAR